MSNHLEKGSNFLSFTKVDSVIQAFILITRDEIKRNQIFLFVGQFVCHLSFVYGVFYFTSHDFFISVLGYALMTCVGVSIVAHRQLSHRSIKLPFWFEMIGSVFFILSIQGSTIAWVALHKEHHRHADKSSDPHSPLNGILKSHSLSMFTVPKLKYCVDLLKSPFHQFLHRHYWKLNILFDILLYSVGGFTAVLAAHWVPAMLCWEGIAIPKTLCHLRGYKNFTTRDESRNLPILGYVTFGEAFHNNHHARPGKASFQHLWHEIDISFLLLKLLKNLRIIPRDAFNDH